MGPHKSICFSIQCTFFKVFRIHTILPTREEKHLRLQFILMWNRHSQSFRSGQTPSGPRGSGAAGRAPPHAAGRAWSRRGARRPSRPARCNVQGSCDSHSCCILRSENPERKPCLLLGDLGSWRFRDLHAMKWQEKTQCHLLILQTTTIIKLSKTRLDHLNSILRKGIMKFT